MLFHWLLTFLLNITRITDATAIKTGTSSIVNSGIVGEGVKAGLDEGSKLIVGDSKGCEGVGVILGVEEGEEAGGSSMSGEIGTWERGTGFIRG